MEPTNDMHTPILGQAASTFEIQFNLSIEIGRKKSYHNNAPPKKFCCFKIRNKVWSQMPDRQIYPLVQDLSLPDNKIQTSKYTWLTFLPINLAEQFSQLANVYFLVIFLMML